MSASDPRAVGDWTDTMIDFSKCPAGDRLTGRCTYGDGGQCLHDIYNPGPIWGEDDYLGFGNAHLCLAWKVTEKEQAEREADEDSFLRMVESFRWEWEPAEPETFKGRCSACGEECFALCGLCQDYD